MSRRRGVRSVWRRREDSALAAVRSQWILRRRGRPVVPVLRGPMPHRGVKCKEQRARLLSLYFRPWVMRHAVATIYVPHIGGLDAVQLNAKNEPAYPQAVKRLRLRRRTLCSEIPWATRSYDRAWQSYIRGNVVSEYSARLIQTFLTIMSGTGKLEHDEEAGDGGRLLRKDLGSPGQRLRMSDVHEVLTAEKNKAPGRDGKASTVATRIDSAMRLVQRLVTKSYASLGRSVDEDMRASRYHRVNSSARDSTQREVATAIATEQVRRWKCIVATGRPRMPLGSDAYPTRRTRTASL